MFQEILYYYGNQILSAIMCAIFGIIGYAAKQAFTKWANSEEKRSVARDAAKFVEQTWTTIHGKDKLHKALEVAEMEVLIEAAVGEFNKVFAKSALSDKDEPEKISSTE